MQWERRTPLWPKVAGIGLLLVLVLVAPTTWQTTETARRSEDTRSTAAPSVEVNIEAEPQPEDSSAPVGVFEPAPAEKIVLTPELAIPPSPTVQTRPEVDLETLGQIYQKLLALIDQLPAEVPTDTAEPTRPEPAAAPVERSVRVANETDRLAMLPPRPRRTSPTTAQSVLQLEAPKNDGDDLANSSRNRSILVPPKVLSQPSPRIAMIPSEKELEPQIETLPLELPAPDLPMPAPPVVEEQQVVEAPLPTIEISPALRHRPKALIGQLKSHPSGSIGARWSERVLAAIDQLTSNRFTESTPADDALVELQRLHAEALQYIEQNKSIHYSNHFHQTVQALGRRLMLWQLLLDPEQLRVVESAPRAAELWQALENVTALLGEADNAGDWRGYLSLDRIVELTSEGIESPTLARAKLAQGVLARMSSTQLSDEQLEFLRSEELVQLRAALRPWAAGKVNLETLAALIECYEEGRQNRYAEAIAQVQQRLKWSEDPKMQQLAVHLDQHFRGANMRIAMSDVLMNRMLPQQKPIVSPVSDRVAGAKVRGQARTTTELRVRLKPDPEAWHVRLEANGKVYSHTRSDTWPARIRNAAKMQYQGHKDIAISQQGVTMSPAEATAKGRNELVGVDSELDPIPIVGHLLRDMARKKHKKSRPTANSQAKSKVVRQVKERMDTGLAEKLESFEQKFRAKVMAPIEELALLAEPLDMHTTQQRAVMQLRLANNGQLAAHTLRPYAPSDSVLSVQMHETALNNAMMGLDLDGRRMTMMELFEFLTSRFGRTEAIPPADMPRRAVIEFAKRDAARLRCEGDRMELILSVAELAHRRDKIRNFEIHVHFRPVLQGLGVRLVRDGTLQFSGRRLKTGPRVVLHSVLGKVLPEEQQYTLVSPKLMLDPRFQGLMVTQLVLEDGWLALAIGPAHARRTAQRTSAPEVLSTPFVR